MSFRKSTLLLALFFSPILYAQSNDETGSADTFPTSNILWDVSSGGGIIENYGQVSLGLSKSFSANASLIQASDGTQGYAVGFNHNFTTGWLGGNYKSVSVNNDFSTQTYSLNSGRIIGNWDLSFTPNYIQTSVYSQKGSNKSNTISAPGISLGVSHHGQKVALGINAGVNFYTKNLENYVTDSRAIGTMAMQSKFSTTGLEKSYWSVYMQRYQSWGNWGLDYLDSLSAVDSSHSQYTTARMSYYLGQQVDLRFALIRASYASAIQDSISLGVKYYW